MKVNTDGVLLGAMAASENPLRILDIGTGTGVIALMLAQRFPRATVDALEIDAMAAATANRNFGNSAFAGRIVGYATALGDFDTDKPYDLVVSNPPYFLHSLKNQDVRKQVARHADRSFFSQLLDRADRWLTAEGSLQLVLPIPVAAQVVADAVGSYGMAVQWMTDIRSFALHPPIRRIVALGRSPGGRSYTQHDFVIYASKGVYSQVYRDLLKDFFLAF